MRTALISDIHGNLIALDAVLADIDRQRVDQIVCLGDVATLGPDPCQVIEWLRRSNCPCITGNHDAFLLDPDLIDAYSDATWFRNMVEWCAAQLSEADFAFLRSFRPLLEIPLGDEMTMLCFHGSPRSDTELLLAATPAEELEEMLGDYTARLMVCGHTHVPMLRWHKGLMIVNAGSVGAAFEQVPFEGQPRLLPCAEYAIVDWTDGMLGVELRWVPVDADAIAQAILTSDMPHRQTYGTMWLMR